MKLETLDRADLFGAGRAINPMLGDLFQNPVELTKADIQYEIDMATRHRDDMAARFNSYIEKLEELRGLT